MPRRVEFEAIVLHDEASNAVVLDVLDAHAGYGQS